MASASSSESQAPRRQVYVRCNGRALATTVSEIVEFFADCGKPTSILNKNGDEPKDGKIFCMALVTFKKDKALDKGLALSGKQLSGREVIIGKNLRNPKKATGPLGSVRVFCGNLPFDASEAEVKAIFGDVGTILFVRFAVDEETGGGRGFCHVIFQDDGSGDIEHRAIAKSGTTLREREISVAAAVAKPPKRKKQPRPHSSASSGGEPATKALRPSARRRAPTPPCAPRPPHIPPTDP